MSPSPISSPSGNLPDMTAWLEEALVSMPATGRFGIKVQGDLTFGFTDDRKTEKGNQDRLAVAYSLDGSHPGGRWFFAGVCDGVGGEARGDIAASLALAHVIAYLCSVGGTLERRLSDAIRHAHSEVQQRLHRRSATTFVGVLINDLGGHAIGSVGDSRAYSVTDAGAMQLTQDDTVAEMLRRQSPHPLGQAVDKAINALQPQWQESLGQAIGSELPMVPNVSFRPRPAPREGLLLCTDGVWKCVDPVLQAVVTTSGNRIDLARRLLTLTDHLGASDNSTAIVIPDIAKIGQWLREASRVSEQGLIHLVLPVESAVVPGALFGRSAFPTDASPFGRPTPTSTPTPTPRPTATPTPTRTPRTPALDRPDQTVAQPPASKNKRKSKSVKEKKVERREAPIFQMTIVEGDRDGEPDAPGKVPEDKK